MLERRIDFGHDIQLQDGGLQHTSMDGIPCLLLPGRHGGRPGGGVTLAPSKRQTIRGFGLLLGGRLPTTQLFLIGIIFYFPPCTDIFVRTNELPIPKFRDRCHLVSFTIVTVCNKVARDQQRLSSSKIADNLVKSTTAIYPCSAPALVYCHFFHA